MKAWSYSVFLIAILVLSCGNGASNSSLLSLLSGSGGSGGADSANSTGGGSGGTGGSGYFYTTQAPELSPDPSRYSTPQTISMSSATDGATIIYTLDGSDPSRTNGQTYEAPVDLPLGSKLKAIAMKNGLNDSEITVGAYNDPNWLLKTIGGFGNISVLGLAVTTDKNDNVFIAGANFFGYDEQTHYTQYVDFDPGSAKERRNDGGGFVVKINSDGTHGWMRRVGSGTIKGMVTDSKGNIYVTGFFDRSGNFDFEHHSYNDQYTPKGNSDIFITKINSDGTYGWTKTFGGTSSYGNADWARAVAVDSKDNVYITGNFWGEVDFNPGEGVDIHRAWSTCGYDHMTGAFVTKLHPDGSYGWTLSMTATVHNQQTGDVQGSADAFSIALDSRDNIYVAGSFSGSVDFDPYEGTDVKVSNVSEDIFVTKINSNGTYSWTKAMGSTTGVCAARSLCIDRRDNVYVTGIFMGSVNFNRSGGNDTITSSPNGNEPGQVSDCFIMKLGADGAYYWTKVMALVIPMAITTDRSNNVFITGYYNLFRTDFDPTSGVDMRDAPSDFAASNMFVTKLDACARYGWTEIFTHKKSVNVMSPNYATAITTDSAGRIIVAGTFASDVAFDAGGKLLAHVEGITYCCNAFLRRITR